MRFKNHYYILRHGQTIHQTEKKGVIYQWPDDNPPCSLTEFGNKEAEKAAERLRDKNIDLIFASDARRTKQTAGICANTLEVENIELDRRLRDLNWGIFQGKNEKEAWIYYSGNKENKFEKAPPKGESWNQVQERMIDFIEDLEKKYKDKNILIISHGGPLWLLEGYFKHWNRKKLLEERGNMIATAEIRILF